jgi:hypothetical protein
MRANTTFPSNDESPHVIVDIPPTPSKREQRLDKAIAYFSSKMFLVQIIITAVFSATELNYGINYRDQCPIEPWIALFLTVHGSTKLGWVALSILAYINAKVLYGMMNKKTIARYLLIPILVLQLVFTLWFLAWFIAGNVWVFSNKSYVQYTDPTNTSTYCQQTLYSAAFGLIISTYIVVGIIAILTIKRRVIGKKIKAGLAQNQDNDHRPM